MARQPARLERAGALTPRDRIWQAIRALAAGQECTDFTPAEIMVMTGLHVDTVCTYFRGLRNARPPYLRLVAKRPVGRQRRECFRYMLARDVGASAPGVAADGRQTNIGEANRLLWSSMKALRVFTRSELVYASQSSGRRISMQAAASYLKFLRRAGYITIIVPSRPGSQARYRFLKNTGPRAPLLCRDKSVLDANSGATMLKPAR